ncbi:MAG: thioredoxin [Thermoleophilia bacterium]
MTDDEHFEATAANFDAEVLESEVPIIVDFWADWCAPCRMVSPLIREIAEDQDGGIRVAKLNIDDHGEIAERFGVMSIPTVVLFKDGEPVKQVVGVLSKEMLIKELGLNTDQQ